MLRLRVAERKTSVLKLRRCRLIASFAARCRALFGAKCRRIEPVPASLRSSQMTNEEIDHLVRAMILAVESLEPGPAKQSMQEAFTQVVARREQLSGRGQAAIRKAPSIVAAPAVRQQLISLQFEADEI
jgi:hypothetical protein